MRWISKEAWWKKSLRGFQYPICSSITDWPVPAAKMFRPLMNPDVWRGVMRRQSKGLIILHAPWGTSYLTKVSLGSMDTPVENNIQTEPGDRKQEIPHDLKLMESSPVQFKKTKLFKDGPLTPGMGSRSFLRRSRREPVQPIRKKHTKQLKNSLRYTHQWNSFRI